MPYKDVVDNVKKGDTSVHPSTRIVGDTVEEKRQHTMEILRGQMLDILVEDMSDDDHRSLMEHRGGCSCPHVNPPCSACTEPLRWDEVIDLGWLEE